MWTRPLARAGLCATAGELGFKGRFLHCCPSFVPWGGAGGCTGHPGARRRRCCCGGGSRRGGEGPSGGDDASRPGKELVSEAKPPSGHMLWKSHLLPRPGLCGRGGQGPGRTLFQGEPPPCSGLALALAPGSVLLLLFFRCGCGEFVLNPEALHKEVDDGPVQVLVQGGAVQVMAFVGVDL